LKALTHPRLQATTASTHSAEWVKYLFYSLPFLAVISPTGAFYGVDTKLFFFIPLILLCAMGLMRGIVFTFLSLMAAFVLYGIAQGNDFAWISGQTQAMLMWLLIGFLGTVSKTYGTTAVGFIRATVIAIPVYAVIKAGVLWLYFSGTMGFWPLILALEEVTGHRFVSWEGEGFRVTASNENIVVFFPFFIAYLRRHGAITVLASVAVIIASIFILVTSNSRLLFIIAAIYGVIFFRSNWFRFVFVPLGGIPVLMYLRERFQNSNAELSDRIRANMQEYLFDGLSAAPFLGNGLGWYHPHFIRFEQRPWLYELQLLSTAAQVGIIGSAFFFGLVAFSLYRIRVEPAAYGLLATLIFMAVFNSFLWTISSSLTMLIAYSLANRRF
jgi:hypothetical protein